MISLFKKYTITRITVLALIQWVCGKLTGHVPGPDWGYGCVPGLGEPGVDTWCKFCDKMTTIPMEQACFQFPELRKRIQEITGKLPRMDGKEPKK